jgi:hypothetical protein
MRAKAPIILIAYLEEDEDACATKELVETGGRKAVLVRGDIQDAGHCEAIIRKAERWRAAELPFTRAWPHSQTWRSSPSLACSIRRWRDRG